MKKRLAIIWPLIFMLISLTLLPLSATSYQRPLNNRLLAMGSAGVALRDSSALLSLNPALLYYQESSQLMLGFAVEDAIVRSAYQADEILPWMQNPRTTFRGAVSSRYVGLLIELDYLMEQRQISGDQVHFQGLNLSKLQLIGAIGNENIAIGISALGGTKLSRAVTLSQDEVLWSYIRQSFFERYYPVSEVPLFQVGVGLLLSYEGLSMAVTSESLFQMDYERNELVLDLEAIGEDLRVGLGYTSPQYTRYNELNPLVASLAFDLSHVFLDEERQVHAGFELLIQLLPSYNIALRLGYRETQATLGKLFTFDGSDGITTYGLGVQLGKIDLSFCLEVPLTAYGKMANLTDPMIWKLGVTWLP